MMLKGSVADRWHFYIPLIVMPLSIVVTYFTTISYQITMIAMPIVLILLQFINETIQRADSKIFEKYGSLESFLENSRIDWANFWLGLLLGLFAAGITIGLLINFG